MRSFVFTVGTSTIGNVSKHEWVGIGPPAWAEGPSRALTEDGYLHPWCVQALSSHVAAQAHSYVARGAATIETAATDELRALGAEAESLARLALGQNEPAVAAFGRDEAADALWLLASDTPKGVLSACVAALLIGRHPRIRPITAARTHDPVPLPDMPARAASTPFAEVVVVQGLGTHAEDAVPQASQGLARALRLASGVEHRGADQPSPVDTVVADFSGGYKALIPIAVHFLEYLAALRHLFTRAPERVQLWFRHELTPEVWHRVGLRQLGEGTLKAHTKELGRVARGFAPVESQGLEGFAYIHGPDELELTDVGQGLQVLLDQA